MTTQPEFWSRAARSYEQDFIDPYRADVRNPLLTALAKLASPGKTAADLGCGIGPLLPFLADHFGHVHAVDFAEGMLARARERAHGRANVDFHKGNFTNLAALHERGIFNCTGLGARALFGDAMLQPVRGQLTILEPQPEINYIYLAAGPLYMFPRSDGIVLGGTFERGNWSTEVDLATQARILAAHEGLFAHS